VTRDEVAVQMLDASPNAYVLVDRDLRVVDANRAYYKLTGSTPAALRGSILIAAFPNDANDPNDAPRRMLRESLLQVVATGEPDHLAYIPYRVPRAPGEPPELRVWSATHTPILDEKRSRAVVSVVTHELLTPYGLRTLARGDARYASYYGGDVRARDGAYHQGTVWPWLIGPYVTAYVRAYGRSTAAMAQARGVVEGLIRFLAADGLGQLPELFDAEAPQHAGGCIAQAWSVAEIVRLLASELRE